MAAFVGEPLMAAGGVVPPPAGYWEAVQAVLREHDVLLVADEVCAASDAWARPCAGTSPATRWWAKCAVWA